MGNEFFHVNEIYSCLQGEGYNAGKPAVLVRFQSCNLNCSWCDSLYAIVRAGREDSTTDGRCRNKMDTDAVVHVIKKFRDIRHLIFTGGEPVLQNFHLIKKALDSTYTAEVESNATLIYHKQHRGFPEDAYSHYQWNLSPKLSNAGQNINPEALQFWSDLGRKHPKVFFKFVVTRENAGRDMEEIRELVTCYAIDAERVFLMPEGTTVDSQVRNEWLYNFCLKYNYRYSPRLHILLFDNRRGV